MPDDNHDGYPLPPADGPSLPGDAGLQPSQTPALISLDHLPLAVLPTLLSASPQSNFMPVVYAPAASANAVVVAASTKNLPLALVSLAPAYSYANRDAIPETIDTPKVPADQEQTGSEAAPVIYHSPSLTGIANWLAPTAALTPVGKEGLARETEVGDDRTETPNSAPAQWRTAGLVNGVQSAARNENASFFSWPIHLVLSMILGGTMHLLWEKKRNPKERSLAKRRWWFSTKRPLRTAVVNPKESASLRQASL